MSDIEVDDVEEQHEEVEEQEDEEDAAAGSDADEEESSQQQGKKKGAAAAAAKGKAKGKTAAKGKEPKAAKAAKSDKKASPAKRKESGGDGPAAKKAKVAVPSDPKEHVRQYMVSQNRPYTALVVYENLHQSIKKPALIKIMDELTEEGHLQAKDFKKVRMYLAKQHESDAADPAELDALTAKEAVLKESLADVKGKNARLSESLRALANEPSDADLATQLAAFKKQVDGLNARLARIKGDGKQVSKADMDKVQLKFNDAARAWVKRKRAANDMIAEFCGDEGDPKQLIERFGIETDEDAEAKLSDWKDLIKDIKK